MTWKSPFIQLKVLESRQHTHDATPTHCVAWQQKLGDALQPMLAHTMSAAMHSPKHA
jgi:hypothetical protein